ncbi:major facilitator MFS-1 [Russula earlei]|uniref:Major facilitator MFS-1 n=1 Tax=Russula earlei TaxID=71964 RepID=A0ACC0UFA2_9AGAM|nr:major facilitator MFS-1 [Russula earlei]
MSRSGSRTEHRRSPTRVFGPGDQSENDNGSPSISPLRYILSRHPSILSKRRSLPDRDASPLSTPAPPPAPEELPLIPSALQKPSDTYATPLPKLSMIVLSITLLGEFLTANVSMPFLIFMVQGFPEIPEGSDVGFASGLLVAAFFFTQFLTSLLWATIADKHGQRLVLFVSLLGSSVTCALFGTSTSLKQAIVIRLMHGVFAGAVGVARGCVTVISDPSNEGRAYAILGFCWGLGGVAGAIVGGAFESPSKKWPNVFEKLPLFVKYPYLLPTCIAASVTLTGSILSLFLGPDGGPREGAIRLPPEKITDAVHPTIPEEESLPSTPVATVPRKASLYEGLRKASRTFSGVFASRVPDLSSSPAVPLSQSPAIRPIPRTSRADGHAYGYGSGGRALSFRSRLGSNMSGVSYLRGSHGNFRRRASNMTAITGDGGPRSFGVDGEPSFAQRLLLANENAVTNIADLWVAAAMNVDNEEVFENDDADMEGQFESVFDLDGDDQNDNPPGAEDTPTERGKRVAGTVAPSIPNMRHASPFRRPSTPQHHISQSPQRRRPSQQYGATGQSTEAGFPPRRFSNTVPAIFAHSGVKTPPAVAEAQRVLNAADPSQLQESVVAVPSAEGMQPSLMSQLPMAIIFQYGWLALHTTTHDMVFLTYVVGKFDSGGLGLSAGDFAQLSGFICMLIPHFTDRKIAALMCLAQIAFQFYLYPNIGPPRGRFSHLAMFRLGTLLFIPGYLTVALYRVLASPGSGGSLILMIPLTISTAVRYCGATFTFTSVSILLNYMSPPPVVGFANGVAQSIVSLARFFGPLLGGYIWTASVQGNPSGYYVGFLVVGAACALAVFHTFFIH